MMNLSYTLSLQDYQAALKLHRRLKFTRRAGPFIWPVLLLVSAVVFVFASLHNDNELAAYAIAIGAGSLTGTVLLPVLRIWNTRRCFKQIFSPSQLDRTIRLDIDHERILSVIPGHSEGKIFWPAVHRFAQNDRATLIYLAERKFLFFPTSALSPGERSELANLVAQKGVKQ